MQLGEKRLFILVSAGGLALLGGFVATAWYLIAPRLAEFYEELPGLVGGWPVALLLQRAHTVVRSQDGSPGALRPGAV